MARDKNRAEKEGLSPGKVIPLIILALCLALGLSRLFMLEGALKAAFAAVTLLFMPLFIINAARAKEALQRFSDVNTYIEQFLYSFVKTGKILDTLRDVEIVFEDGTMKRKIDMAIHHIENSYDSSKTEDALGIIEREYNIADLSTVHDFAINVEKDGGDYQKSAMILLEARQDAAKRGLSYLNEKKHLRNKVGMSVIVTVLLCLMIFKVTSQMSRRVALSPFTQAGTLILLTLDIFIFYRADRRYARDDLSGQRSDDYAYKLREKWDKYIKDHCGKINPLKKIFYKADMRAVKRQIEIEFPSWLLNMSLLLQNDSVFVALERSVENAPLIIKKDIEELIRKLSLDPFSIVPYMEFLKEFDIQGVNSAMKVLYSLSSNGNGSSQDEIGELLRQNRLMQDNSDKLQNDNRLAGFGILFLMPQISGGIKLMIDMMVLFASYLAEMGA